MRMVFALVVLVVLAGGALAAERPPNVVIVFTDDQGYGDLGVYGAKGYETPHIDRMAAEGMRFTSFYVSEATCSASRASLLTGCYAQRVSMEAALMPTASVGLHPDEETIAELLKARGYATCAVGKWHLGHLPPFLPTRQGFDEYLGLPYSNDMWPVEYDGTPSKKGRKRYYPDLPLIDGEEKVATIATLDDQGSLTGRYTERALDFIARHKDEPFFLYLAHSMAHVPLGVSERFRGKSEQGLYGDVIMEIDDSVGQVLAALEQHGLAENTIVVFLTDNGPWLNFGNHAGSTGGLREGKGTIFEGGPRVPCIVRWPGKVEAGAVCDELAASIDLLPTIAALTEAALPKKAIDGVSLLPLLEGATETSPRDHFVYFYGNQLRGVRDRHFKWVLPHSSRSYAGVEPGMNGWPGPYATWEGGPHLYDLHADPAETTDVQAEHPEVVARLQALAAKARVELGDGITKTRGTKARPIGRFGDTVKVRPVPHRARGKTVVYTSRPALKYDAGGDGALVDGRHGTAQYNDGRWQGFEGEDLDVVIDLAEARAISRVDCTFLEAQAVWIFLPRRVEVLASEDGVAYQVFGAVSTPEPTLRRESSVRAYRFAAPRTPIRYLRVRAFGLRRCPPWHPGAGGPAWVFADEVVVH